MMASEAKATAATVIPTAKNIYLVVQTYGYNNYCRTYIPAICSEYCDILEAFVTLWKYTIVAVGNELEEL